MTMLKLMRDERETRLLVKNPSASPVSGEPSRFEGPVLEVCAADGVIVKVNKCCMDVTHCPLKQCNSTGIAGE